MIGDILAEYAAQNPLYKNQSVNKKWNAAINTISGNELNKAFVCNIEYFNKSVNMKLLNPQLDIRDLNHVKFIDSQLKYDHNIFLLCKNEDS